jgi:hypothetical protein
MIFWRVGEFRRYLVLGSIGTRAQLREDLAMNALCDVLEESYLRFGAINGEPFAGRMGRESSRSSRSAR